MSQSASPLRSLLNRIVRAGLSPISQELSRMLDRKLQEHAVAIQRDLAKDLNEMTAAIHRDVLNNLETLSGEMTIQLSAYYQDVRPHESVRSSEVLVKLENLEHTVKALMRRIDAMNCTSGASTRGRRAGTGTDD